MFQYLGENLKYPVAAQEAGQQGKVYCGFVVNADGHLSDFEVIKGICPELDEEAIRVIKAMPAWTPGKKDGKAVNVRYTLKEDVSNYQMAHPPFNSLYFTF